MVRQSFRATATRRAFLRQSLGLAALGALAVSTNACSVLPIGKPATEITLANTFVGDDAKFWDKYIDQFKKQTGITVKHLGIPFQGYHDKMVSQTTARSLPDVIWTFDATIAEQAGLGGLKDLLPLANQEGAGFSSDFVEDTWKAVQWNGKLFSIPWVSATVGLFMNTQMFREAGLVDSAGKPIPPKDWPTMLDYIQKTTKPGQQVWGYTQGLQSNTQGIWHWSPWLYQNKGWYINDDLTATFNNDAALEAYGFATDIFLKYQGMPDPSNLGITDYTTLFAKNKVAMMYGNQGNLATITQNGGKDFQFEVFYPGVQKLQYGANRGPQWWSLSAFTKETDAAWQWGKFISNGDIVKERCYSTLSAPLRQSIVQDPTFLKTIGPLGETFAKISVQPTTRALPMLKNTAKMMDLIQVALQGVVSKQKTLKQALDDAAQQWNEFVKNNPQR
jgi:multiple sugar transport system substrate-binding protein